MDEKIYINKIFNVNITKDDINELLLLSSSVENGIINVVQENTVASAKSLIGLLNIDYDKPMKLLVQAYLSEEEINEFKKWRVN
jgi:hypothetical protein